MEKKKTRDFRIAADIIEYFRNSKFMLIYILFVSLHKMVRK